MAILNKEWFLLVGSEKEGPFTLNELLGKREFNCESWVWKPGMKEWKRAKDVPELTRYFVKEEEEITQQAKVKAPTEDSALVISYSEPPWFFLIVALIVVLIYAFFLLFN